MVVNKNGKYTTIVAERNKYLTVKDLEDVLVKKLGYIKRIDVEDLQTIDNIVEKNIK